MRGLRPGALLILASLGLAAGLAAWAGDTVEEDPEAGKISGKLPVKKFDLTGVDVRRPSVEPKDVQKKTEPGDGKKKPKEIVKYRSDQLVPEGAELVVEIPDAARLRRSAAASPLGRLMGNEMLGRIWRKKVLEGIREVPAPGKGLPSGGGLLDLVRKAASLFAGQVLVSVHGPAAGGKGRQLLLVGEVTEEQYLAFLDSLEDFKKWSGFGREARTKTETSGAFEFYRLTSGQGRTAAYGRVGNQLVLEVGGGLYEKVLECAASKGDRSLAKDRDWTSAREKLGRSADLYIKVQLKAAVGAALEAAGAKKDGLEAVKALTDSLRYFAASLHFTGGAVREHFCVELERDSPLLKMMPGSPPNPALAKMIPLDAIYFNSKRTEPGATAQSLKWLKGFMPEAQLDLMRRQEAELKKKTGLSLEKDILPAFEGDAAQALVLTGMGPTQSFEILAVLKPVDRKKTEKVLAGLERATGQEFQADTYMGARLKYWVKPVEEDKPGKKILEARGPLPAGMAKQLASLAGPLGWIKAYAVTNQYVILGSSSRIVKLAVRQKSARLSGSSILEKPDFKAARALVPATREEISVAYLDLRRLGEFLYGLAGQLGASGDLPPADKILGELRGVVWSVRRGGTGASVEVASPVGTLPLTAAGLMAGGVLAMNQAAKREQQAHTRKLKTIWRGLETFATDFGRYPLKLSELYPVYVEDGANFLTPEQQAAGVKVKVPADVEKSGYCYLTGRSPNSAANTLVTYTAKSDARGRHWCLYASGKVRWVAEGALAGLLGKKRPAAPAER